MLHNNNTVADTEKYYNNTRGYYNIILINDSNVLNAEQSKTYRHFFFQLKEFLAYTKIAKI